ARRIPVDYASHSHHVEPLHHHLTQLLAHIKPQRTEIEFYSTVTGDVLDTTELTADYWYRNLRQTVRLDETVRALHRDRFGLFIESSPHPVLTYGIQQTLDEVDPSGSVAVLGTLRRDQDDHAQFLTALATAWTSGAPLTRWTTHDRTPTHTDLPTYPFQRTRHWITPQTGSGTPSALGLAPTDHLFLKTATTHPDGTTTYTGTLNLTTHPWLTDHTIHDTVLLPATALLDLTLHAAHDLHHPHIEELTLHTPTPLTTTPTQLHLTATPPTNHTRTLTIHTRPHTTNPHTPWTHTATATLTTTGPDTDPHTDTSTTHTWPPTHTTPIPLTHLYDDLTTHGYTYGPTFQGLTHAWKNHTTLHATTTLPTTQTPTHTTIHPALLDAALHPLLTTTDHTTLHLPTTFTHTTLHTTHATTLHTTLTPHPTNPNTHTLTATDPHGTPVITTTLTTTPTTPTHLTHTLNTLNAA
ncbi:acyltransferase domain-containing protein, partial [Kitasatospora sp. NPDC101176]|uniref:acyltransferase domain-containing protein n=1 Tax=Kitasatospora sp. NPDC101176 TaxID=3364099 RepID=UPI00380115D1